MDNRESVYLWPRTGWNDVTVEEAQRRLDLLEERMRAYDEREDQESGSISEDLKQKYREQIVELRERLHTKSENMGDAWTSMKDGWGRAMDDIAAGVENAFKFMKRN